MKYGDTRTLYFHSPSARDNTVFTREISRHISLISREISIEHLSVGLASRAQLTLSAHAREGYSIHFVCQSVCVSLFDFGEGDAQPFTKAVIYVVLALFLRWFLPFA